MNFFVGNSFLRKLRWLRQRPDKEAELREELQFHLEEETEERKAEGWPEDDARWAARRELGNLTLIEESTRAALVRQTRYRVDTCRAPDWFVAGGRRGPTDDGAAVRP